eukprot:m.124663 g.124663  ORF g.124663 m.124663 type:complete len:107 (-) comp23428_c0_seq1:456-776(-)
MVKTGNSKMSIASNFHASGRVRCNTVEKHFATNFTFLDCESIVVGRFGDLFFFFFGWSFLSSCLLFFFVLLAHSITHKLSHTHFPSLPLSSSSSFIIISLPCAPKP